MRSIIKFITEIFKFNENVICLNLLLTLLICIKVKSSNLTYEI